MNTAITSDIAEVLESIYYRPAISIILPFDPKMKPKKELSYSLEMVTEKVERELSENYPVEMQMMMMQKLRTLIKGLNFDSYRKSIAIYVSPVFEKILYLDIIVEEKVIIDESFEIRDLLYCKKQLQKHLVLLLSSGGSRIYLGNSAGFVTIVSDTAEAGHAYEYEPPERIANFSDQSERKEIRMHKLLHHIDNTLELILNAYHLPLFVLGTARIMGHFKKMTRHTGAVVEYIEGNYEDSGLPELREKLDPYITDWNKIRQKDLLNQLEEAAGKKRLAFGMQDVWREATSRKGRLLVVQKNYMYAAEHGSSDEIIYKAIEPYNKFSYIKDAVDDVMEKVLENGGDVEFADEGLLKEYDHIALILYY